MHLNSLVENKFRFVVRHNKVISLSWEQYKKRTNYADILPKLLIKILTIAWKIYSKRKKNEITLGINDNLNIFTSRFPSSTCQYRDRSDPFRGWTGPRAGSSPSGGAGTTRPELLRIHAKTYSVPEDAATGNHQPVIYIIFTCLFHITANKCSVFKFTTIIFWLQY